MTVKRVKDVKVPRVFMHKIADIRGGVSVCVTELGSDFLPEGTPLSAPVDGICHVVKVGSAVAAAAATDKAVKVAKGHQFKAGDAVMASEGGAAAKVSSIDSSAKGYDTLALSAAIGAVAVGGAVVEAKAAGDKGELKYVPLALSGTGKPVVQGDNLDVDAWLIGVTKGNALPEFVASHLPGIINY